MKGKKILFGVLTSLFIISCGNQDSPGQVPAIKCSAKKEFNGKIKTCIEKNYSLWDGNKTHEPRLFSVDTTLFDTNGKRTEVNSFYPLENFHSRIKYSYDNNGHLIEMSSFGTKIARSEHKYDDKGNEIETDYYWSDSVSNYSVKMNYNSKNQITVETGLINDGSTRYKVNFVYDNSGNLIERRQFGSDGNLNDKFIANYDVNGYRIEENNYNANGSLKKTQKWKYDKNGNVTEIETYKPTGSETKDVFQYEYDDKGNWVKEIFISNGETFEIHERQIIYY